MNKREIVQFERLGQKEEKKSDDNDSLEVYSIELCFFSMFNTNFYIIIKIKKRFFNRLKKKNFSNFFFNISSKIFPNRNLNIFLFEKKIPL